MTSSSHYFRLLAQLDGTARLCDDVNMAKLCSLYDLSVFAAVRNSHLFKLDFRSLPSVIQCDVYRQVSACLEKEAGFETVSAGRQEGWWML